MQKECDFLISHHFKWGGFYGRMNYYWSLSFHFHTKFLPNTYHLSNEYKTYLMITAKSCRKDEYIKIEKTDLNHKTVTVTHDLEHPEAGLSRVLNYSPRLCWKLLFLSVISWYWDGCIDAGRLFCRIFCNSLPPCHHSFLFCVSDWIWCCWNYHISAGMVGQT